MHLPWSLMHSAWQRPQAQHDIAEYLAFARSFMNPDLVLGGWQSRLVIRPEVASQPDETALGYQVRDRGAS